VIDPKPCIACGKPCERGDLHNACAGVVELMLKSPRPGDAEYLAACAMVTRRRWLDGSGGEHRFADDAPNPAFVPGHTLYVGPDVIARVRAEAGAGR
jgi:hypothetical protein